MSTKSFKRVLIANRGEIAVRIARTLRDMGIVPVAVFSDADRTAPHVRACDMAVHVGESTASQSYLDIGKIIDAARKTGAEAIHPGYGFLSENAEFAQSVQDAGVVLIGPSAESMQVMGSKTRARETVAKAGVPLVPGTDPVSNVEEARAAAEKLGYPILLKASAGGGGKGMRLAHSEAELESALRAARSEAQNAFGDATVYLEKAILEPKHVEIQVFGGPDGKSVWLGERECSMQRRHQKIIEESPSPVVDDALRAKMGAVACQAADAVGYVGAGTVELLLDTSGNFYFLEMNTRLQVEHPVTEMCCGLDLVEAQVRVAQGEPLPFTQESIERRGHAIEARLYAEDPEQNFMPCPGFVESIRWPAGPGIRVDGGVEQGFEVPRFYDPMIAKIVAWGADREQARRRLRRALQETRVGGITTNLHFLRALLDEPTFVNGKYHTGTVAEMQGRKAEPPAQPLVDAAIIAAAVSAYEKDRQAARQASVSRSTSSAWRLRSSWRWGA